jgi:arylsulfatase A-like enzyme
MTTQIETRSNGDLNLVLITIDCWRYDHFTKAITPNIFEFAADSFRFDSAYANGPWTPPSVSSLMTSAYPFMFTEYCPIPNQKKTLAESLKKNGFTTFAINSNVFLSKFFGFNRGFDRYTEVGTSGSLFDYFLRIRDWIGKILPKDSRILRIFSVIDRIGFSRTVENSIKISADKLVREAWHYWSEVAGSKFCWCHFMDSHAPYSAPLSMLRQDNGSFTAKRLDMLHEYHRTLSRLADQGAVKTDSQLIGDVKQVYTTSIKFVDAEIGKFLAHLSATGDLDRTIVIITSDHGELFMEHGFIEHPARMYDELLHVPLIIHVPPGLESRFGHPRTINTIVDLITIAPTILDLLDIPQQPTFMGRSLVPLLQDDQGQPYLPVISQTYKKRDNRKTIESIDVDRLICLQNARWKFIFDTSPGAEPKLFSRIPPLDESINLAPDYPEIVSHFMERSADILAGRYSGLHPSEEAKIAYALHKLQPILRNAKPSVQE